MFQVPPPNIIITTPSPNTHSDTLLANLNKNIKPKSFFKMISVINNNKAKISILISLACFLGKASKTHPQNWQGNLLLLFLPCTASAKGKRGVNGNKKHPNKLQGVKNIKKKNIFANKIKERRIYKSCTPLASFTSKTYNSLI